MSTDMLAHPSDSQEPSPLPYDQELQAMLLECVRGGPKITDAHMRLIEKDLDIGGTKTIVHCYAPTLDANGRLRTQLLAEYLLHRVIDYAIPRKSVEAAQQEFVATGSAASVSKLHEKAKELFTNLKNSGEGGELLLFAFAEAVFSFTQILCKMSLKTSTSMHYHGADGIYAELDNEGFLNVFWGESKLYKNPTDAITDCLKSLAPFLKEPLGQNSASSQDLFLINEHADLSNPSLVAALKRFFNSDDPQSNKLRMSGIALVGFDCAGFPQDKDPGLWDDIELALRGSIPNWQSHIGKRVGEESLESIQIHFICIPMRSVEEFRAIFLKLLEN